MKYTPPSGGSSATETSRPPARSSAADRRNRSPPAVSNTTSTGSTASSKRVDASTVSCAPSSRTASRFAADAVPITCAPRARASWTANRADATRGTVNQDALGCGEPGVVEQSLPGGERGQRDRGALGVPERARPRHQQLGGQRRVVGCDAVAVERREREHLVAGRDAGDAGSDFLDHSGELVGRDRRQAIDRPFQLVTGDRRRVHADERLRRTRSRPFGLLDRELLGAARRT